MNKVYHYFIVLIAIFFSFPLSAKEVPQKVDEGLGYRLIKIASGKAADDTSYDYGFISYKVPENEDCCAFTWYAVNIWTGDVWDRAGCKQVSNPALRQEQAKIRQQFNADEIKEYNRLHVLRPLNPNLDPC